MTERIAFNKTEKHQLKQKVNDQNASKNMPSKFIFYVFMKNKRKREREREREKKFILLEEEIPKRDG